MLPTRAVGWKIEGHELQGRINFFWSKNHVNPSGAEAGEVRGNKINTMAADALARWHLANSF